MIVNRSLNTGLMLAIVHDEKIFDAISEDDANPVKVDVIGDIWLEVESDNNIVGCVQLVEKTSVLFEAHIHILPEHRDKSIEAGEQIWFWITQNLSGTIYATVPFFCKNVMSFLEKFDFQKTGKILKAWTKNNERHDLIIMSREV